MQAKIVLLSTASTSKSLRASLSSSWESQVRASQHSCALSSVKSAQHRASSTLQEKISASLHKVPELRRQVGTVFQDFRLLPNKTISENIAFSLHVLGYSQKEINREVPEMLELVGLEDKGDRLPSEISGGEQQRVDIARAYVTKPPIIIADEPTGNLDPELSVGIMKLLDRINREGTTVLMATHDSGIVDQMRKRVIELDGGHVIRDQVRGVYGYTG